MYISYRWFLLRLHKAGTLAPVKKAKFIKLVAEDNIQFDGGMVDEFAKRFRNEDKKVDLELMLERYLSLYPETALPVPKEKKKKKGQEKEEIVPIEGEQIETQKSPKGSKEVQMSLNVPLVEIAEGGELETRLKTSLRSDTSKRRVSFAEPVVASDPQLDSLLDTEEKENVSLDKNGQENSENIDKEVKDNPEPLKTPVIVESSKSSKNEVGETEQLNKELSKENLVDEK